MQKQERLFYLLLGIIFVVFTIICFTLEGTNGGGDSVNHYLMSRYSWKHHVLFFNHWGKPLFTILSSPFAQLGFPFIKLFNVICLAGSCYFTFKISRILKQPNIWWLPVLYLTAPEVINVTLSGLTEPLFALLLSASIFLYLKDKVILATIIVSFLPMSRSEGLFMIILSALYLITQKHYKTLFYLLTGQLFINLLGALYYDDLFWVITKIPYATATSNYWPGPIYHFAQYLPFVFGLPLMLLFYLGLIKLPIDKGLSPNKYFKSKVDSIELILIYGSFLSFFIGHSIFYKFSLFNEMGLTRVLVAVHPAMVLIGMNGVALIDKFIIRYTNSFYRKVIGYSAGLITIFLCYGNSSFSIDYHSNIVKNVDQKMISDELIPYLDKKYSGKKICSSDILIPFYHHDDPYAEDPKPYFILSDLKPMMWLFEDQVMVWDDWFSVVEEHVGKDSLLRMQHLQYDTSFYYKDKQGKVHEYAIFKGSGKPYKAAGDTSITSSLESITAP